MFYFKGAFKLIAITVNRSSGFCDYGYLGPFAKPYTLFCVLKNKKKIIVILSK